MEVLYKATHIIPYDLGGSNNMCKYWLTNIQHFQQTVHN